MCKRCGMTTDSTKVGTTVMWYHEGEGRFEAGLHKIDKAGAPDGCVLVEEPQLDYLLCVAFAEMLQSESDFFLGQALALRTTHGEGVTALVDEEDGLEIEQHDAVEPYDPTMN